MHVREGYVVRLANQSCSYGKWDKFGIPCHHVLATIAFDEASPFDYVSKWFKKEAYLKAYQFHINPVKGRLFLLRSEEGPLLVLTVKRMLGQPPKKREKKPLGGQNRSQTKLSKQG